MAKSKRRYFIKRLFLACLLLVFVIALTANLILAAHKDRITQTLNNNFIKPVSVSGIYYLPPNYIIVRDLVISENKAGEGKQILKIPTIHATFSLSRLVSDKEFYISVIHCFALKADYNEFLNFLKNNLPNLLDSIRRLLKENMTFSIKGARLYSTRNDGHVSSIKIDSFIKLTGNNLFASGVVEKNKYTLTGVLMPNALEVEKFELTNGNLHCGLWGWVGSTTELKGFIFVNNPDMNLFMLDIDTKIKFDLPLVKVENLSFTINNNPVKLSGKMFLSKPFSCDLTLSSNFRGMENNPDSPLKNINLIASLSSQKDDSLRINSIIKINFPEKDIIHEPLEKIQIHLKDLNISYKEPGALNVRAKEINIFLRAPDTLYAIDLKEPHGKINNLANNSRLLRFSSRFYDGTLEGRSQAALNGFKPFINASLNINEADAAKMGDISEHFPEMSGKLSSWIFFNNYPQPVLKGNLLISNGSLDNSDFFKWLGGIFNLPSIKKVAFTSVSSDFIADNSGFDLKNIRLDTDDVKLRGNFKIGENDLVSSKISVTFATMLLQRSQKFTPLLNLLDTKPEFLDFNFQLSGDLHKMNFQWLRSDFKDELQRKIPNFVKRGLEKKAEKMFESIPEK